MIPYSRSYYKDPKVYSYNPFARPLRADGRRGEAGRHRGTPGVRDDGRGGGRLTKRYADGRQKKGGRK